MTSVGVGWAGLEQQGDAQEALVFSVALFSSFLGKDVVRKVGTIKCMELSTIASEFSTQGCKLPYVGLQPDVRHGRRFAESLSTAKFKSFGVFRGI